MNIISRADARARGLKRYFTGKTCRAGHMAERYVATASCVECAHKLWRSVRGQFEHEIVTVRLRVPKGQLPERVAWWSKRVQTLTDQYFKRDE